MLLPEKALSENHLLLFQSLPLEVGEELVITRMQQEPPEVPEEAAFIPQELVEQEILPPHPCLKEIPEELEQLEVTEADPEVVTPRLEQHHLQVLVVWLEELEQL